MDDLITWLRAQLDDDEEVATEATRGVTGEWRWDAERDYEVTSFTADQNVPYVVCRVSRSGESGEELRHIARHDPARVLREVEAKRAILDGIQMCQACGTGRRCIPHDVSAGLVTTVRPAHPVDEQLVRLLAAPFSDRPGYRDEWRP